MDIRIQIPEKKAPITTSLEQSMRDNFSKALLEEFKVLRELLARVITKKEDTSPLDKRLEVIEKVLGTLPSLLKNDNSDVIKKEYSALRGAIESQTNRLESALKTPGKTPNLDEFTSALKGLEGKLQRLSIPKPIVVQEKDDRPSVVPWPC